MTILFFSIKLDPDPQKGEFMDLCPVCSRPIKADSISNKARFIGNTKICRACYQRIWERSKNKQTSLLEEMQNAGPPREHNLSSHEGEPCSRKGCSKPLVKSGRNRPRKINDHLVCGQCYQTIWQYAKKLGISLTSAWNGIYPARRQQ